MLVGWILSSYSRLLAGILLAAMAVALAGCNDGVAQKAEPDRPVLVEIGRASCRERVLRLV